MLREASNTNVSKYELRTCEWLHKDIRSLILDDIQKVQNVPNWHFCPKLNLGLSAEEIA